MMSTMLIGAVNVYLFKEYFHNTAALSIIGIIQTVTVFIAIPLVKPLVNKFGKKETTAIGMLIAGSVYMLLYLLPNLSTTQFIAISAVGMFGYAFFNTMIWAFVTDVIDYHEFLTGLREDGTVYSFYSFARKVGQAIAGGIGGFAITAIGYDAARAVQTQGTLNGLYQLATIVPAVIYLLIFFILVFLYPLTKQHMKQLSIDLAEQRKTRK
ncbi:MFS transporter [Neobacillus citreus]|uniref:MFS transporter n=1 Tax=Neobacillus citreus TaxID=2833578 RepID=A0A942Y827_9BACI|nr:MFS transporter [Neobacillus citreus]MCH6266225.1 MFS transporter [Neobacillus citreus]